MTEGSTKDNINWSLTEKDRGYILVIEKDGDEHSQKILKKDGQNFLSNRDTFDFFMDTYANAYISGEVNRVVGDFSSIIKLSQAQLDSIDTVENSWLKLMVMRMWGLNHREDFKNVVRLSEIIRLTCDKSPSMDDRFVPSSVTVQKMSLDPWLNLLHYFFLGDIRETYAQFSQGKEGQTFSIPISVEQKRYSTLVTYRPDDFPMSAARVKNNAHRFLQLARRSRKIKKKLEGMPLEKLLNALSFDICGTLLVTDTIELIDSLKYYTLDENYSYVQGIDSLMTSKLNSKIDRAGLRSRFNDVVRAQEKNHSVLTDITYSMQLSPFFVHMIRKLGIESTIETLELIVGETDGITMRGFMELVRRGGFVGDEPAAWTAVLLATK